MKNGGIVSFADQNRPIKDYNLLQASVPSSPKLRLIDATDSAIMALGFAHLKNCKHLDTIILNRCAHMENEALDHLAYVRNSLKVLQVTDCGNVEDSGLLALKQLTNLQSLTVHGFIYVEDFEGIIRELAKSLPNCKIIAQKPQSKE